MSSKKVIKATVSYAELLNRVPAEQMHQFKILVAKNKQYIERLQELPEEPPKINWDYYKSNVRSEFRSLVEEFEKKYNELKIPYPEDTYACQIDEMRKDTECRIENYVERSNRRIQQHEEKICEIFCQVPFEEMTMEEFCIAYPETAPDFINRPTFWPHTKDEQLPTPEEIAESKRKAEQEKKTRKAAEEETAKLEAEAKEASTKETSKDEKDTPDKTEKK